MNPAARSAPRPRRRSARESAPSGSESASRHRSTRRPSGANQSRQNCGAHRAPLRRPGRRQPACDACVSTNALPLAAISKRATVAARLQHGQRSVAMWPAMARTPARAPAALPTAPGAVVEAQDELHVERHWRACRGRCAGLNVAPRSAWNRSAAVLTRSELIRGSACLSYSGTERNRWRDAPAAVLRAAEQRASTPANQTTARTANRSSRRRPAPPRCGSRRPGRSPQSPKTSTVFTSLARFSYASRQLSSGTRRVMMRSSHWRSARASALAAAW